MKTLLASVVLLTLVGCAEAPTQRPFHVKDGSGGVVVDGSGNPVTGSKGPQDVGGASAE